jgi:hypothetical protein
MSVRLTTYFLFGLPRACFGCAGIEFSVMDLCQNDQTMANFLLLRKGRLSGPFTLAELMSMGLQSSDQLQDDQDQTAWRSIFEIEALQDWLAESMPDSIEYVDVSSTAKRIISPENSLSGNKPFREITGQHNSSINHKTKNSFPKDPYTTYEENRLLWLIRFLRQSNPFTIALVFIGVVCSTILLKNIVDEIITHTFPMEQVRMMAPAPSATHKAQEKMFQNALVREWIAPHAKLRKARPSVARPQDIKHKLSLTANKYKTGFFGGISDLQLTINNTSHHFVNQVEIEICYKGKNGDLLETKNFQVESIRPLSSRIVSIPPTQKGVKITYKILNIYASQPGSLSKEI